MSLTLVFVMAIVLFGLAYGQYGRWLERRTRIDPQRQTPAHTDCDGVDYVPTKPLILFGHHFSSIAGAGPILGPIMAGLAFGWGPVLLWIVIGSIFVGGVHDFTVLVASVRHRARSIGEICRQYLSAGTYRCLLVFTWIAMIYVIIVFVDLTAASYAPAAEELKRQGGSVATASLLYILLAIAFGLSMYRWKFRMTHGSIVFVPLVFVALWVSLRLPLTAKLIPAVAGSPKNTWVLILLAYCFIASVLPVWLLLQPRDYLSAYLLFASLVGGAIGGIVSGLSGRETICYPAFLGWNDTQLGFLYPALFITVACGAVSGFHSMVASGTTAKQLDSERSALPVAYGGMLTEGLLAIVALATIMILTDKPGAERTPTDLFAAGMGRFTSVLGISPRVGVTFGLLAVSTFLLTTLDTCTRLARFIFEELFGVRGTKGRYFGTLASLLVPTIMTFVAIPGPGGKPIPAWKAIWPAFGATNQLLAAFALFVVYTWLRHVGRKTTYVLVPMVFLFATTFVGLGQLVYRNLFRGGSVCLGVVSVVLFALALYVVTNGIAHNVRLRTHPR